jgi:dTDP-4-dehydrorhamnose 3,5-epimerase-like enzyme
LPQKFESGPAPGAAVKERATLVPLPRFNDPRGSLLPLEWQVLPFEPRRVFTISGVPPGTVRGCHGHRTCAQLLVAVVGEIEVQMVQDSECQTIILTPDSPALLVPAGIWFSETYLSEGAVLLVLASEPYDPDAMFHDPRGA